MRVAPTDTENTEEVEPSSAGPTVSEWPRLLVVVDDDGVILQVAERLFAGTEFEIQCCPDGTSARALIDGNTPFAALLTDLYLPDSTGLELIRDVIQRQPQAATIIMTANPSMDSVVEALRMGASDYVVKPWPNNDLLLEQVRGAVRKQQSVYQAQVLRNRVNSIRGDLVQRDERLRDLATQIEVLEGMLDSASDSGLQKSDSSEALASTCKMARDLVDFTGQLVRILQSPVPGDVQAAVERLHDAAKQLDSHLDIMEFLSQ